jgi:hypothetical protein
VLVSQTGNRCTVSRRSAVVSNGSAVPPGVAACVVLCLRKGVGAETKKEHGEEGRRSLAMVLHKVSDAVGGKIKVVASSKTYAHETVVKMFPFCQCKSPLFNSTLICTYRTVFIAIILLKL